MRAAIVAAIWLAAGSALAQASIRTTEWRDHTYAFDDVRGDADSDHYEVTLEGGRATRVRVNGEARRIEFEVAQVEYGDYGGDRRDEAIVVLNAREQLRSHVWEAAFVLLFRERSNAAAFVAARRVRPFERLIVARRRIEVQARRGLPNTPYPCTEWLAISESALTQERERCR